MKDLSKDVHDFSTKFELPRRAIGTPPSQAMLAFRVKFMAEELAEFVRAAKKHDLAEMTDALVDLVYVAIGTAWMLNLPFDPAWDRVQIANMTKRRAQEGESKRGGTLDLIKPPGWKKPDIRSLLPYEDATLQGKSLDALGAPVQLDLIQYIKDENEKNAQEKTA